MPPPDDDDDAGAQQPLLSPPRPRPRHARLQRVLSTRTHHTVVLVLIALDVLAIFADIFIDLSACGPHAAPQSPVAAAARQVLSIASLVFSCLFMAELTLYIWAFGWRYFASWIHRFDAGVVIASFVVDVVLHGVLEDIASLVVALRLWRFVRILDEFSFGADEQMSELRHQIQDLETQNARLTRRLARETVRNGGEEVEGDEGD